MSFHVVEDARVTSHPRLASTFLDGNNGAFVLESPEPGWQLWLICCKFGHPHYCPNCDNTIGPDLVEKYLAACRQEQPCRT